jgi:hypothetical protein
MSQPLITFGKQAAQAVIMVSAVSVFVLVAGLGVLCFLLARKQRVFAFVWLVILGTLMAGLTTPIFSRSPEATRRIHCTNTRVQIEMAIKHWAEEGKIAQGADVDVEAAAVFLKGGIPQCPEGGSYMIGKVGQHVSCSIMDHNKN